MYTLYSFLSTVSFSAHIFLFLLQQTTHLRLYQSTSFFLSLSLWSSASTWTLFVLAPATSCIHRLQDFRIGIRSSALSQTSTVIIHTVHIVHVDSNSRFHKKHTTSRKDPVFSRLAVVKSKSIRCKRARRAISPRQGIRTFFRRHRRRITARSTSRRSSSFRRAGTGISGRVATCETLRETLTTMSTWTRANISNPPKFRRQDWNSRNGSPHELAARLKDNRRRWNAPRSERLRSEVQIRLDLF